MSSAEVAFSILAVAGCAQWRLLVLRPLLVWQPLFGLARVTEAASPSATIHTWPVEGRDIFTDGNDIQGALAVCVGKRGYAFCVGKCRLESDVWRFLSKWLCSWILSNPDTLKNVFWNAPHQEKALALSNMLLTQSKRFQERSSPGGSMGIV